MGVHDRGWWKSHDEPVQRATYNPRQFRRLRDVPYTLADVTKPPKRGLRAWQLALVWVVIGLVVFGIAKKLLSHRIPEPVQQERMWKERAPSPSQPPSQRA